MVAFRSLVFFELTALLAIAALIIFINPEALANPLDSIKDEGCQAWWKLRTTFAKGQGFLPAVASQDGSEVCVGIERGFTLPPKLERPKLWGCFDTSKCGDIKAIELPEDCESLSKDAEKSKKKKTIFSGKSAKNKINEAEALRDRCLTSRDVALKLIRNYCPNHCAITAIDNCRKEANAANDAAKDSGCPDGAIKHCKTVTEGGASPFQAKRLALKRCVMQDDPPNLASLAEQGQGIPVGKCGENLRWGVICMDEALAGVDENKLTTYKRHEKAGYSEFKEVECTTSLSVGSKF